MKVVRRGDGDDVVIIAMVKALPGTSTFIINVAFAFIAGSIASIFKHVAIVRTIITTITTSTFHLCLWAASQAPSHPLQTSSNHAQCFEPEGKVTYIKRSD
jgi:hypothetical protein